MENGAVMTDHSGIEPGTTHTRAGVLYAVLAAASAGLLLFLPILLLGITLSVIASVARGDVVAWRGSVDLTLLYAFLITGPGGDMPGFPPQSIAVLEVLP